MNPIPALQPNREAGKKSVLAVLSLAGLLAFTSAQAADVVMTASNASGSSGLTTSVNWSNGQAPSASNDYFTEGYKLRTPSSGSHSGDVYNFAGNSLTLGGVSGSTTGIMQFKSASNVTVNISNLIFKGGAILQAINSNYVQTLGGGTISLLDTAYIAVANSETLNITSDISGSHQVQFNPTSGTFAGEDIGGRTGTIVIGSANAYTGGSLLNGGTLKVLSGGTLGTGSVTMTDSSILTLQHDAALSDSAMLSFSSSSIINLNGLNGTSETIAGLFMDGSTSLTIAGTYTASELNTFFGSNRFASSSGMTLTIVPEPGIYSLLLGVSVMAMLVLRRRKA